eukprot:gb/GFBE01017525.1/.p1 GENE.gb/GFBE01017525.1/~~gb/GFBE01017525.1/.p1  ORF type:complete len:975 (+),score=231.47 gb/GFBE01017525.1/:1-2925(+)
MLTLRALGAIHIFLVALLWCCTSISLAADDLPLETGIALEVDDACSGDGALTLLQRRGAKVTDGNHHKAIANVSDEDASALSLTNTTVAPLKQVHVRLRPGEATALLGTVMAVLVGLSLMQQCRYANMPADILDDDGLTQKVKRLAEQSGSMSLAIARDAMTRTSRNENLGLAFRAGVFALLAALPTLSDQLRKWFIYMRYDTGYMCVLLVWTMGRSVGSTVANTFDALLGTVLAFVYNYIIMGFFPDGYHTNDRPYAWWVGVIYLIFTVLLTMYGTSRNGVRVWCLSYHVSNMMYFLKPTDVVSLSNYSTGFHLNVSGTAFGYIVVTVASSILAYAAVSLPTPRMSHRLALARLFATQREISAILTSVLTIHTGDSEDVHVTLARSHDFVEHIEHDVNVLKGDISDSWWEHFDLGIYVEIRHKMSLHTDVLQLLLSVIHAMHPALQQALNSESRHVLAKKLKKELEQQVMSTLQLWERCTLFISDGVVTEEEVASLAESMAECEKDLQALSTAYHKLDQHEFHEHHALYKYDVQFMFLLGSASRIIINHAENLSQRRTVTKRWYFVESLSPWHLLDRFCDADQQEFAFRNSVSLFLCFMVGYCGVGGVIPRYSDYIASNASLLLSTTIGSALKKNLGRVQGLVLGISLGSILHGFIQPSSNCFEPANRVAGFIITFGFVFGTFFLYQSTTDFSYVFYLMSGFGIMKILKPCSPTTAMEDDASAFKSVVEAVTCVAIISAVDLVLCSSAGKLAQRSAVLLLETARTRMMGAIHDMEEPMDQSGDALRLQVLELRSKANDAAMEPCVWGNEFNSAMYSQLVWHGTHMRLSILNYYWAVRHQAQIPESIDCGLSPQQRAAESTLRSILHSCPCMDQLQTLYQELLDELVVFVDSQVKARTLVDGIRTAKESNLRSDDVLAEVKKLTQELSSRLGGLASEEETLEKDVKVCLHVVVLMMETYAGLCSNLEEQLKINS